MLEYPRWKTIAILGVTVLVCLAAVPSALPNDVFAKLPTWAQRKFAPGYDLAGGSRVQLEVDLADLKRWKLELLRNDVGELLHINRIPHSGVSIRDGGVEFAVRNVADMPRTLASFDPWVRPLAEPPPPNERRRLLVTNVDGRPSAWAQANARPPQPNLVMKTTDTTVRLTLTDGALGGYVVQARDAGARFVSWLFDGAGLAYQLQRVGDDRLIVETPVSIDRLNRMQH